jgi:hypothetical protein
MSVAIPSSVKAIRDSAFLSCSSLTSVTISSSWTSIPFGQGSIPGTDIITCPTTSNPCMCGAGYGALIDSFTLTCTRCPGSTYTPSAGRSYCLSRQPTSIPTAVPSPQPTTKPSPNPSSLPSPLPSSVPSLRPKPSPLLTPLSHLRTLPATQTPLAAYAMSPTLYSLGFPCLTPPSQAWARAQATF